MKNIFLLMILSLFSTNVLAKKFVIFTDQKDGKKAEEVKQEFLKTYPFNTYRIEFEVVVIEPSELECQSMYNIERNIGCNNTEKLQERALALGGDQAMIIKDIDKFGGSGGGVPVMTTKEKPQLMLHEYLHTLGLCDEYEYSVKETELYCKDLVTKTPNTVTLIVEDQYPSDDGAREIHHWDIPWYGRIDQKTPITNSNGRKLGTGKVDSQSKAPINYGDSPSIAREPIGLYEGRNCKQSPAKIRTWQPGGTATIMDVLDAGMGGPMEIVVDDLLKSKGFVKKLEATPEPKKRRIARIGEAVATDQYGERVIVPRPTPTETVDDTSRSNTKSLFEWLTNLFNSIGQALSR